MRPPLCHFRRHLRGCSSAGRALESHSRGQGFDPPQLHWTNAARPFVLPIVAAAFVVFGACSPGTAPGPEAEPAPSESVEPLLPQEGSAEVAEPEPEPEPEPTCDLGTPDGSGGCIVTPADRFAAMSEDERWQHIRTSCPDPEIGSFAETWEWTYSDDEQALLDLDFEAEDLFYDLLGRAGLGVMFRLREVETRDNLCVAKITSANTRIASELYAWRLSVFLGFDELLVPTVPLQLSGEGLERLHEIVDENPSDHEYAERHRQRVLTRIENALAADEPFPVIAKTWISGFIFNSELGNRDRFAASDYAEALHADEPQPDEEEVELVTFTRLYEPTGTYEGTSTLRQIAEDMSNVLVLDALIGNNDRFPGANLHVRSIAGVAEDTGRENNSLPVYDLGQVRVLALDNGAGLDDEHNGGIYDIQGNGYRGTRVERFEQETLDGLRALGRRWLGRGCDVEPYPDEVEAIREYFGLSEEEFELATEFIILLLDYVDQVDEEFEGEIVLTGAPAPQ